MKRSIGIPFLAWVGAAFLAHLMWTAGVDRTLRVVDSHGYLGSLEQSERSEFSQADEIEVTLEALVPLEPSEPLEMPTVPELMDQQQKPLDPIEPQLLDDHEDEMRNRNDPVQLIPIPAVPAVEAPAAPLVAEPPMDQRIAVKQHVEDKSQDDNPNARFIGDEANHVEEETVARITSHDQDDPNPTPGGQHSSASRNPGNADETRIADSEDREGDPDTAPGEHVAEEKSGDDSKPPAEVAAVEPPGASPSTPHPKVPGPAHASPSPAQPASPESSPTTNPLTADVPEPMLAEKGGYSLDPRRKPRTRDQVSRDLSPSGPSRVGLGAGPNDRGVQTSLSMNDVVAVVGADELSRQRAADGERRRSAHRGSWNSSNFERWRGAIENYVSSVRPGNQTALNTAQVPFATYLVKIHNRIHPVFADTFLSSLDSLPATHPMNDYKVMTRIEIVVEPESGRVVKMGVIKTSGITAFDMGALDSVNRSSPFGKAPAAIISTDGNVYLHWEFHRNPIYACSTLNAHPYMLNLPPREETPNGPPRPPRQPSDPRERGLPPAGPVEQEGGSRFGMRRKLGFWMHSTSESG